MMQTSGFTIFLVKSSGISERKIGIQSDLPSATGFLTLAAMKKDKDRNIPEKTKPVKKTLNTVVTI